MVRQDILRIIPDAGQSAVYEVNVICWALLTDTQITKGRRDKHPHHLRLALLQQCPSPRYVLDRPIVLHLHFSRKHHWKRPQRRCLQSVSNTAYLQFAI